MNHSQPFLDDHVSEFQTLAIRCVLASVLVGELVIVAYSKAENRFQDEAALHNRHSDANIRGEWFNQSAASAIAQ